MLGPTKSTDIIAGQKLTMKMKQKQKQKLEQSKAKDQELGKWGTLNVLGQPAEPICTYYLCHHKFSLHGSRGCRCKHPMNKTLGIQVRYS